MTRQQRTTSSRTRSRAPVPVSRQRPFRTRSRAFSTRSTPPGTAARRPRGMVGVHGGDPAETVILLANRCGRTAWRTARCARCVPDRTINDSNSWSLTGIANGRQPGHAQVDPGPEMIPRIQDLHRWIRIDAHGTAEASSESVGGSSPAASPSLICVFRLSNAWRAIPGVSTIGGDIRCSMGQNERVPSNIYPRWEYFARNVRPPEWVEPLLAEVRLVKSNISTVDKQGPGLKSNAVLRELAPGLRQLGYTVESSRSKANRIRRSVLYGNNGRAQVAYDIDAFHDDHGIVIEVEAGRAASNNATYRNIIRASLILDAQYLVQILPVTYRFFNHGRLASVPVFTRGLDLLSALYSSQRLALPLNGVLLIGY